MEKKGVNCRTFYPRLPSFFLCEGASLPFFPKEESFSEHKKTKNARILRFFLLFVFQITGMFGGLCGCATAGAENLAEADAR